jgi:hypothetical protein
MSISSGRSRAMSRRQLIPMLHSLSSRESRRRLWHMTPGLLAFPLQFISHADPLSPTLRGIILAVICLLSAQIYLGFRRIQREQRENGLWAVAGYALSVLGTIVLFPDRLEVGLALRPPSERCCGVRHCRGTTARRGPVFWLSSSMGH